MLNKNKDVIYLAIGTILCSGISLIDNNIVDIPDWLAFLLLAIAFVFYVIYFIKSKKSKKQKNTI